ncbi:MAG: MBOAT family protein [Clostridia bacterium]|nr:MBOAT family protein [Clostridia bacterium]
MVFSSITFIFYFLPIVLAIYYMVPKKMQNLILLVASLLFYFYGEPKYVILMVFEIIVAYLFGRLIDKKHKKIFLIIPIAIIVGLLVYFKYIDFLIQNVNVIFEKDIDLVKVILPIGISFYTFQIISYIVDVYRGEVKVQKNILNLATYVALFPQLIAGPIVRYKTIDAQLDNRKHSIENVSIGIRRFVIGLGKKVLIANVLGELVNVFLASNERSVLFYWLYAFANMMQIYFDFSGYSDMAIGLVKMFGFEFPENFNYPYISSSITEFWRRWHISLGTWFRDYIYIPLGGNRVSKIKHLRNILIVWLLTGLWHGAAWNFIIWGLYFGILLILEKEFILKKVDKIPKIIRILATFFIVMISFIIFSGESKIEIFENIKGLFGIGGISLTSLESIYYLKSYAVVLIISLIGATPLMKNVFKDKKVSNFLEPVFILFVLIISTSYIIDGSFNPFLYFRF